MRRRVERQVAARRILACDVLLARVLPVEKLNVLEGPTWLTEEHHESQTIGQIRVAGQIYTRIGHGGCTDAAYEAEARNGPGHNEILQQIVAVLIERRTNSMSRQVPGLRGQLDADVAADLTDPYPQPIDCKGRQPQP